MYQTLLGPCTCDLMTPRQKAIIITACFTDWETEAERLPNVDSSGVRKLLAGHSTLASQLCPISGAEKQVPSFWWG